MKDQFVTFELAVKLKDLGFDKECIMSFNYIPRNGNVRLVYGTVIKEFYMPAPLWQQALDWCLNRISKYSIRICHNKTGEILSNGNTINLFDDLEECLEKLIELCKKNTDLTQE